MRFPLRVTLFGSFALLVVVSAVGQALLVNSGLREELLAIQELELSHGLGLAPSFFQTLETIDPDSASRALARRIGYPVTLLSLEGLEQFSVPGEGPCDARGQPGVHCREVGGRGFLPASRTG